MGDRESDIEKALRRLTSLQLQRAEELVRGQSHQIFSTRDDEYDTADGYKESVYNNYYDYKRATEEAAAGPSEVRKKGDTDISLGKSDTLETSDSDWPSHSNPLCGDCRTLDIRRCYFTHNATSEKFLYLGYLSQMVKNKSCPLCRLVALAFSNNPTVITELSTRPVRVSISWWNDVWEGFHDGHDRKRLKISSDLKGVPDAYLVLLDHDSRFPDLRGTEVVNRQVDMSLLQSWFTACKDSHGPRCKGPLYSSKQKDQQYTKEGFSHLPHFRVIDVQERCLVKPPLGCEYLTLSYVWGLNQNFVTTKAIVEQLERSHGLDEVRERIPRTIQDAMELTSMLQQRYLWADALCIVQDDLTEKLKIIYHMDEIYGNSILTIVNATGDAHGGIAGVQLDSRDFEQHIEEIKPRMRVMLSRPLEDHLRRTVYQSRAWTYQERMLSPRCLIFLSGRAYFQCRRSTFSEDIVEDATSLENSSAEMAASPAVNFIQQSIFTEYSGFVGMFTQRLLSFEGDILNAWAGMEKVLSQRMFSPFFYGLPTAYFDLALLWQPTNRAYRRKGFPSWSWAGWKGPVVWYGWNQSYYWDEMERYLRFHTFITWCNRHPDGRYQFVWSKGDYTALAKTSKESNAYRGYDKDMGPGTDHYGRPKSDQHWLPPKRKLFPSPPQKGLRHSSMDLPGGPSQYPYLHFYTYSATFILFSRTDAGAHKVDPNYKLHIFNFVDAQGDICGAITLDEGWKFHSNKGVEVLILSDAYDWDEDDKMRKQEDPGRDEKSFYESGDWKAWDLFYVMLIEWHDDCVARRVGVGKIFKLALERAFDKEWKEITLG